MKKKTLKQQVKSAEKKILEENKDFYEELIESNYPKKNNKTRKLFAILAPSFAAVLTLVLCLVFLLPNGTDPIIPPTKHYLIENEKGKAAKFSELEVHLQGLIVDIGGTNSLVSLIYDYAYGDTLYFVLDMTISDFEKASIYFYINTDYENQLILEDDATTIQKGAFHIEYKKDVQDDDGLFTIKYRAKTEYKGLTIFITHTQFSFDEESNFFNFFEQTIKTPA